MTKSLFNREYKTYNANEKAPLVFLHYGYNNKHNLERKKQNKIPK